MKMERLIGILTILLQQEQVTAPALAARFEVSRRTINRDIEELCKAGIPLVTTQGYGGGIAIAEGYKIDKTLLTQDELQMALAAFQGLDSISKTSYLAKFSDKLLRKGGPIVADELFIIDLASHYQESLTEKIDLIKKAIWSKRLIAFEYYSATGQRPRRAEPYRLVFQWSSWYVLGYCLSSKAFRLFKLNRLWGLESLDSQFTPREIPGEALDFGRYFQESNFHLKALFSSNQAHRLVEEYGAGCYCAEESGKLLFEQDFVSYENMRQWVFGFGDQVLILEPQALIEDRKRQAQNILKQT